MPFTRKMTVFCLFSILIFMMNSSVPADPGNINGDDRIDLQDAVLALQALSNMGPPGLDLTADVDGDGRIGLAEAIYALQWASSLRGTLSGNANLSGLTLSDVTLIPGFNPALLSYTAAVESDIFQVTVTPTAADSAATISVNGTAVQSGNPSAPILLDAGLLNSILILVTAQDQTTKTYTVNVFRQSVPEGKNANLAGLTLSSGDLNESFHPDILTYTATVPLEKEQVSVTATTEDTGAMLMINNATASSGAPSAPVSLVEGENDPISILVISEDGTVFKTYQITVTRGDQPELSPNAFLSGLSLTPAGLNEAFFAGRLAYTALVPYETQTATVSPTTEDPEATVTVDGSEVVSGQASQDIPLSVGENTVTVVVTAPDGVSTRTYEITLTREGSGVSTNALLSSLSIDPGSLDQAFSPGNLSYTAHVLHYVDQVTVTATAAHQEADITVNGVPLASGQPSGPISLALGENTISVVVTAQDGVTLSTYLLNISRHGATGEVSAVAFVVDPPASAPDEFETLSAAIAYLSDNLASDQLGEVRVRTSQPMQVSSLEFDCNIIITIEQGASSTIMGPGSSPLAITANGSLDLAGLTFVNAAGFAIHSGAGLAVAGSHFSGDTTVEVNSGISPLSTRAALSTRQVHGAVSKDLEFNSNQIDAGLTINTSAATQKDIFVTNTTAASLGVNGSFTGQSHLNLSANPVGDLTLSLNLRDETTASVESHLNLNLASADIDMEGAAQFNMKSSRAAQLEAQFHGLKGQVRLENTIIMKGAMNVDLNDATFDGSSNSYTDLSVNVGYSSDLVRFGFTENGGYAYKTFQINAPDAPSNAEITVGFDNFKFNGDAKYYLGGKAKVQLTNNTVLGAEGHIQFKGSAADCTLTDLTGQAKLLIEATDSSVQFNLSASRVKLADDLITETATANISGHFDEVEIMKGIVRLFKGSGSGGLQVPTRSPLQTGEETITISGLTVNTDDGRTPLMIEGLEVPVTIENCDLKGQYWSMALLDLDGDVTIRNNSNLTGGIMLDGDPEQAGNMISRQYTVSNNTITQSMAGGSCLSTHAIRNVLAQNNTMTASGGAHGVLVYGGKVIVRGGTVITSGPPSQALGVAGSAGGSNGILYAEDIETVTGGVQTAKEGWVRLTDNTFANAKVVDYKEGQTPYPRLLNDPVADNSGLNPDEDIIGSLIDWNKDTHHCPDYPPKCDEWDEDNGECGCGEDGVDAPAEPGV